MDKTYPIVIGISGISGSGKTKAISDMVSSYHGVYSTGLTSPMKNLLADVGCTEEEISGDLRDTPHELLCGKTPREFQGLIGKFGREQIGEDLWMNSTGNELKDYMSHPAAYSSNVHYGPVVVMIDNIRFQNEVDIINSRFGGIVLRLSRGDNTPVLEIDMNVSSLTGIHADIRNDGTVFDLHDRVSESIYKNNWGHKCNNFFFREIN